MVDENEFVKVIKQHEAILFKITTIYAKNKADQEDLYQDMVYQLWKSFGTFRNDSKLSTWIYRVALNTALTKMKNEKRKGIANPIENVVMAHTESGNAEFEVRLKLMYQQIHRLNVLEKGVVLLLLDGKSYQEISEITGLSPTNVGTRISRIKQKLRSKIVKN